MHSQDHSYKQMVLTFCFAAANYEKHALRVSQVAATVARWICRQIHLARCSHKSKADSPTIVTNLLFFVYKVLSAEGLQRF